MKYDNWDDWYNNGPGSESFKRSLKKKKYVYEISSGTIQYVKEPQCEVDKIFEKLLEEI